MKNIVNETKIIKWIILLPIIGVILTSFILTNIFISSKHQAHDLEIKNLKEKHISNLKEKIKERIEYVSILLNNNYQNQLIESRESVKGMVNIGHTLIENIYKNNKNLSEEKLYKTIDEKMKNIRFFKNDTGYFFIQSLKTGVSISLPANPDLVGTNLSQILDKDGKNLFQKFKQVLNKDKEGYVKWYWNKPNSNKKIQKIGYAKKFEPLDLYIGSAVYLEDVKEKISNTTKKFVKSLIYDDNSYIFIMDTKGTALVHKNESIINIPIHNLDKNIQKNVQKIIDETKFSEGIFLEYLQSKELFKDFSQSKKISYVKRIPILDWIIGTGLYTNDLEKQIKTKHAELEKFLEEDIKTIIFVSSIVTFFIIILLIILSKRIKNLFQFYSQKLEDNNSKLIALNNELEKKVEKQVSNIREKDIILNQQSKLAAMGEMLGNIAHQWRQPLSAISTIASGIRVQKEMGIIIDDKQLDKDLDGIVKSTIILSDTIDDFRNFYSQNKHKNKFGIENTIEQVLNLISANIKNKGIELIFDTQNIELNSYENELIQVILNIMNNAKDALLEIEGKKYIFVKTKKETNTITIQIYDNARGIKENILNRVFEPYFTTKFKSQGTGIGLYMTKNIIESSLNGQIFVENKEFVFKDKEYKGALFTIKLPLS